MASLSELPFKLQVYLRTYPWRTIKPVPWASVRRPLADCRVGIVSSAGFALPSQAPFDPTVRGGDPSFRVIPADADLGSLVNCHRSDAFDHGGVLRDPNLAFPLQRVEELVASRRLGSVARQHLSFMGSITAPGRLIRETAPQAAEVLVADRVDVALLVPV